VLKRVVQVELLGLKVYLFSHGELHMLKFPGSGFSGGTAFCVFNIFAGHEAVQYRR
jgi:hypothetical protein